MFVSMRSGSCSTGFDAVFLSMSGFQPRPANRRAGIDPAARQCLSAPWLPMLTGARIRAPGFYFPRFASDTSRNDSSYFATVSSRFRCASIAVLPPVPVTSRTSSSAFSTSRLRLAALSRAVFILSLVAMSASINVGETCAIHDRTPAGRRAEILLPGTDRVKKFACQTFVLVWPCRGEFGLAWMLSGGTICATPMRPDLAKLERQRMNPSSSPWLPTRPNPAGVALLKRGFSDETVGGGGVSVPVAGQGGCCRLLPY